MKLTLTGHEQIAVLGCFIQAQAPDSAAREKSFDLAKKMGLINWILEIHAKGKLELTLDQLNAIPDSVIDIDKDTVRKLQTLLNNSPSTGTNSFVLYGVDCKLEDLKNSKE